MHPIHAFPPYSPKIHPKYYIHFPLLKLFQTIHPIPKPCGALRNKMDFYGEEFVVPRPTPKP